MLYSYPEEAATNFHKKIDSIPNIVVLIGMEDEQLVGGFTEGAFDPKPNPIPIENPHAFMFNLKHRRWAFANRITKTHSYDPNYLLLGNWEIKLKACSGELESTWDGRGGVFTKAHFKSSEPAGHPQEWLLGSNHQKRPIPFLWYKIFCLR